MKILLGLLALCVLVQQDVSADIALMKTHCSKCHSGADPEGDFNLVELKQTPDEDNLEDWIQSLEKVKSGDMPPADENRMSTAERQQLIQFLRHRVLLHEERVRRPLRIPPRRMNNRELANSLRDVLMIEDVGTQQPLAMLLGDNLYKGFDTHGETLGFSEYHLDQYVTAIRNVLDATILVGDRPATRFYDVPTAKLAIADTSNRARSEQANRTATSIELLDLKKFAYFTNFKTVPTSGRYRIKIRAVAVDRHVYDSEETGIYDGDPLQLRVHLGDRVRDFDLVEGEPQELVLDEWLAAGTDLRLTYPTDGLRLRGNGNFKFQYRIAHDYIKANDPELYRRVVTEEVPRSKTRRDNPEHWVHWTGYWQGPRPRLFSATVEGPFYAAWPPQRQTALLGIAPDAANAAEILKPIARRAWRHDQVDEQLAPIVKLVQTQAETLGDVESLKEGILAILVSPSFLLINPDEGTPEDRFATKLSYFLSSTVPNQRLRAASNAGKLDSFDEVRGELQRQIADGGADELLREFPRAWLQLDRINFMAPDPERYPLYEKKSINEDMVNEVLHFFRHAVRENRPVPEMLAGDDSFVNADLAKIYELDGVANDSIFRQHTFTDGRRGGFLGMGAFLTLTADSLGTSPIHRAVYVMENFMGIEPSPPPADVKIEEPDVRSATTIREVLQAHQSDRSCAACHQAIDPFGYAFENFDPAGAWRDHYQPVSTGSNDNTMRKSNAVVIPIDASASFMSGAEYSDIVGFRKMMKTRTNQERFVRCFVSKLLLYANGIEAEDYSAVDAIVKESSRHEYRIIETIAAVIDSPLFREARPAVARSE
ncbi:hypothetical protein CKO51_01395 [Rhodopirellula sp. SM50]|nr:DUF1588 domain-containing protein [Rhodopirellula sp. SM50]PAY21261.1 hypothetical protein CKO51_01395 [Rhodopirellula sp. SM50]